MRLALYEPDIPPNVGTILRLAACFGVPVDIIEPCGFPMDDRQLRRAGMDYLNHVLLTRHASFAAFQAAREHANPPSRLILLTTKGDLDYHRFQFAPTDTLVLGRESAGAPPAVHEAAAARLRIPMRAGLRSINVALAGAIVLSEALRQTDGLPKDRP
ncbi:MAG: tRNA (cytidine(34)-2'-O)-methyltransferase [Alphaproteobacteria bacterium]|nr:tRNA (cytidine(34)-2'-O)-methyltransferase [Alphaproteobacteria bacterium]